MRRWTLFWGGIVLSIGLTALLWSLGIAGFGLFLLFPFLLFPWARRGQHDPSQAGKDPFEPTRCSLCGRVQMPGDQYCPRDGQRY